MSVNLLKYEVSLMSSNKMVKKIFVFLVTFYLLLLLTGNHSMAIYDPLAVANNRVGIHIFDPGEITGAAEMINASGGEWGYVTVPIRIDDRRWDKWQKFMDSAKEKKVIPILRLATVFEGDSWIKPVEDDILDFANFLSSLTWPTLNRYIIVFNKPNHAKEWGVEVSPEEYTEILRLTIDLFKSRSDKFFILPAGLDAAAPDSATTLSIKKFITRMAKKDSRIFFTLDGWTSHAYPNPAFSGLPTDKGPATIIGYRYEINYIKRWLGERKLPIFITETGWQHENISVDVAAKYLSSAFGEIWTGKEIVAITPFVFSAYDGRDGYNL